MELQKFFMKIFGFLQIAINGQDTLSKGAFLQHSLNKLTPVTQDGEFLKLCDIPQLCPALPTLL